MPIASQLTKPPTKALIYGRFGTWKTSFTMTLGKKLQLLTTDQGGWVPALHIKDKFTEARQAVDIVECYEDVNQPGSGLTKIKNALFQASREIAAKTYKFDGICIDNLTSIGSQSMRMVLSNSGRMELGAVRTNKTSTGIEIQHWGLAMIEVENILNILCGLPILGVALAHDDTETIEGRQQKIICVIGAKLAPKVPTMFNEVWYSLAANQGAGKVDMVLQTQNSSDIPARSRDGLANGFKMIEGFPAALASIGYKWEA